MRGSPRRKQTTAMARTSSSLARGLRSCRGNRSLRDVARLSMQTNWRETGPNELLVVADTQRGDREKRKRVCVALGMLPECPGPGRAP